MVGHLGVAVRGDACQRLNATVTQSGTTVTAAAPAWASSLAPGASVTVGFTANGTAATPGSVKLNGTAC
ncbi:cellulose binding domain-containing protein [Micromonospora sp. b486]|uniref:cellulose binding domain-containing protein n=1 Tax=Micromonospora sp. b486 TaxID=3053986 RepID=UPI00259CC127|nr:cellulose binding domain-containing protein [Micromonospora sp. b486]MDM4778058.1 cellulose binding domain-containing protein [Micromonospora sp. b486]